MGVIKAKSELHESVKQVVVKYLKNWPRNCDSKKLLETLDSFAKDVIETQKVVDIAKELNK